MWRRSIRLGLLAGTLVLCGLPSSAAAQGPELLPDLRGLPAEDLIVRTPVEGGRLLRLSTTIANGGAGAFEVFPVPGNNCDGDGNPANDRVAYQRIFNDVDGNGFFDRGVDTGFADRAAGCMIFHPAHNHWHFEDFADYELRLPGTGEVIAEASKVSFCAIDFTPYNPTLPGYSAAGYFDSCDQDDPEGISVGWSDTYDRSLAGQSIDIQGVPDGQYCLAVTGDPSDIVRESDESNNSAQRLIELSGNSVTDTGQLCPGPAVAAVTAQNADVRVASGGAKCKKKAKRSAKKKRRRCRQRA